jgi:hypothetical protein
MNNYIKASLSIATLAMGVSASIAMEKTTDVVTEATPDSVLLAGKDKSTMFEVAEPSTKLTMTIEGIDGAIEIAGDSSEILLVVDKLSKQESRKITQVFYKVTGKEKAEVKLQEEAETLKSE